MIFPINNIEGKKEDVYLVKPGYNFNNVFPKEYGPTLFPKHNRLYLAFLVDDSSKPTVYQVKNWYNSLVDDSIELRLLSKKGAKRVRTWIDPIVQGLVDKVELNIEQSVSKFYARLNDGDVFGALESVSKTKYKLENHNVVCFFEYGGVLTLPKQLYPRLSVTPEKMKSGITDLHYKKGISFYRIKARKVAKDGWSNEVKKSFQQAVYCTIKSSDDKSLIWNLRDLRKAERQILKISNEINDLDKIILEEKMKIKAPNSLDSWYFAETGVDLLEDFSPPDYCKLNTAESNRDFLRAKIEERYLFSKSIVLTS